MLFFGWWWAWLLFVVVLVALPTGYGWGYRGWGPPYPRGRRTGLAQAGGPNDDLGWGLAAIWLWIAFLIGTLWLAFGLAWWW